MGCIEEILHGKSNERKMYRSSHTYFQSYDENMYVYVHLRKFNSNCSMENN